jgi:uncharacterized protein YecT (DUF1311 family)
MNRRPLRSLTYGPLASAVLSLAAFGLLTGPALAQATDAQGETVGAGRFDGGKMWTFEYAPAEYFSETYDFDANEAWFERARMAAVRIPGCSASFVSPNGLLATNHHCVRSRVSAVSGPGEVLLDSGFYAMSLDEERPIPGYYVDQLIAIEDVTDEVIAATESAGRLPSAGVDLQAIQSRLLQQHASGSDSVWVQVVPLYNGGRHSAYVFRRFTDVRLVMAVELSMGFFGGDPDNFTYPRYALDFAFLRVYEGGEPFRTNHHFEWGVEGVEEGDVVFVIGNPGPTTRLTTMSQLEFLRDVQVPAQRAWLASRHAAFGHFRAAFPELAEELDIRNRMFSLSNSLKAAVGRLDALHSTEVMARRSDGERQLRAAIADDAELEAAYGKLFERMADLQRRKAALGPAYGAFYRIDDVDNDSRLIRRMALVHELERAAARGVAADTLAAMREGVLALADHPEALEQRFLAGRLTEFERHLGPDHPVTRAALVDGSPEASAAALLAHSALATAERTRQAMETGDLAGDDPARRLMAAWIPAQLEFAGVFEPLLGEEAGLARDLGRVKFEVYGQEVAPDATFSPRITDGLVRGFEYNGTLAPPHTTFFGIYDRHHGNPGEVDWELPDRWRTPPAGLDLSTPLNFVSTADTYGGNSGSPAVTRELALVGLNFDRNIQGLSRDYIYLPERGRNVMVDARAIQTALDHAYDADRIVQELVTGTLFQTEAEADQVGR